MVTIVTLNTNRSEYDIREAAKSSCTVRELVDELLSRYNENDKIVFSNDNGYTYGYVGAGYLDKHNVETEEEEELREKMGEILDELAELENEFDAEPEETFSKERYISARAQIFKKHGITEEEFCAYYGF